MFHSVLCSLQFLLQYAIMFINIAVVNDQQTGFLVIYRFMAVSILILFNLKLRFFVQKYSFTKNNLNLYNFLHCAYNISTLNFNIVIRIYYYYLNFHILPKLYYHQRPIILLPNLCQIFPIISTRPIMCLYNNHPLIFILSQPAVQRIIVLFT